jgi:hypothetical protein
MFPFLMGSYGADDPVVAMIALRESSLLVGGEVLTLGIGIQQSSEGSSPLLPRRRKKLNEKSTLQMADDLDEHCLNALYRDPRLDTCLGKSYIRVNGQAIARGC